ncbi:hypothetical protein [Plantibacter sp. YIM 135249]|uniref:hypothetical protein n=1 Tax=Plantibacter sp. YIM 135249 TaxID=3423918 RepID=UPI003D343B25
MNSVNPVVWFRRAAGLSRSQPWPVCAVLEPADVLVGTESLARAAEQGTPFVRNVSSGRTASVPTSLGAAILADAILTGAGQTGLTHESFTSVLVTRVEAVLEVLGVRGTTPYRDVWVDAELTGCLPRLEECRVIGRLSSAELRPVRFRPCGAGRQPIVEMPADLRAGDLLAIPCDGPTALYDVQQHSRHIERLVD